MMLEKTTPAAMGLLISLLLLCLQLSGPVFGIALNGVEVSDSKEPHHTGTHSNTAASHSHTHTGTLTGIHPSTHHPASTHTGYHGTETHPAMAREEIHTKTSGHLSSSHITPRPGRPSSSHPVHTTSSHPDHPTSSAPRSHTSSHPGNPPQLSHTQSMARDEQHTQTASRTGTHTGTHTGYHTGSRTTDHPHPSRTGPNARDVDCFRDPSVSAAGLCSYTPHHHTGTHTQPMGRDEQHTKTASHAGTHTGSCPGTHTGTHTGSHTNGQPHPSHTHTHTQPARDVEHENTVPITGFNRHSRTTMVTLTISTKST